MKKGIVLYTKTSKESAYLLSNSLGADIENPYETKVRDYTEYDYVFKFGFSRAIHAKQGCVFNKKKGTEIAIDKLKTFAVLSEDNITVDNTTSKEEAYNWLRDGHIIVARLSTTGSNGEGLIYIQTREQLDNTQAPLWTKLVNEVQEFRAYVWRNKVISLYVKTITKRGTFNFKLIKEDESYIQPQLTNIANVIYNKIGLDFCGIDIITDTQGKLNVLEVNSAPILFPYTLKRLVKELNKEINK